MAASDSLFTRIDTDVKTDLEQLCKNPSAALREKLNNKKLTERLVIERALRYLFRLPEEMRNAILSEGEASLALFGEALEDTSWCEHAFRNEFWNWSFKEYWALSRKFVEVAGIQRISTYYESYSFMGMHDDLLSDALEGLREKLSGKLATEPPWQSNLKAAAHALHLAIHFCAENEAKGGKHPVVPYNIACSNGLRCVLLVIETLAVEAIQQPAEAGSTRRQASRDSVSPRDLLTELVDVLLASDTTPAERRSAINDYWRKHGRHWRRALPKNHAASVGKTISNYTRQSLEKLRQIDAMKEPNSPYNPNFLVRLAENDKDLAFIRNDESSEAEFDKWVEGHAKKSRLDDFVELLGELPSHLQPEWLGSSPKKP